MDIAISAINDPRSPALTCGLARNTVDIALANQILKKSYVEEGYWSEDNTVENHKHLGSPARHVIVLSSVGCVIGTASVVVDSRIGLPADAFEPEEIDRLRLAGERIAEISGLAIDRSFRNGRTAIKLVLRFIYHLSWHYLNLDRLIVVCNPKHVGFYESIVKFYRLGGVKDYQYVNAPGQLLTLELRSLDRNYSFHRYLMEPLSDTTAEAA